MPAVREIEHCWIPMPDGCRLAARVWLPADAARSPVPAVLEYIPYRKRDFTRARDEPIHGWFAAHGYAAVRVDVRGSGDSDGVLADEYTEQELADAEAVIAWIAAQPWCTGAVGMMGKSWGGFNALQVAARRPPALRAVVTVCGSDDRYGDDAHYMGGCLLNENLTWGTVLLAFATLPPDPMLMGDGWRETWLARLDAAPLFPERWLRHQLRDDYWRRGSVAEDLARIECPVYAVGGWADAYTNAIPRLVGGLAVARRGLVGPWGHVYPHAGVPGPAIGFLHEARRWWERWLRGANGDDGEPAYRVWMQDARGGGRWVAEARWPSSRIAVERRAFHLGRLADAPGPDVRLDVRSPETLGVAAGDWCSFGVEGDRPTDQRADDAGSLVFDSEPLDAPLEILGAPTVTLDVAVDRPRALVAVRLNEVRADGASVRVTYGVLNLTHRAGHARAEPLVPGRRERVTIALNDAAHAFAASSRIRVAVSTAYWPIVWPSPERVTLSVFTAASALALPVRPPSPDDDRLRPFEPPESAAASGHTELRVRADRTIDEKNDELVHTITTDVATRIDPIALATEHESVRIYRIRRDDPLSAEARVIQRMALRRDAWSVRIEADARLTATTDAFRLDATLDAFEDDRAVRTRTWNVGVPRDGL
jgi:putative CocE/NonD family hydrolase